MWWEHSAEIFFHAIDNDDVISWNTLIVGYTLNGRGKDAVDLVKDTETKRLAPDQVTFVGYHQPVMLVLLIRA